MSDERKPKHPSFAEVKTAALRAIDSVLARWLPGGKLVDANAEYTAPNPTRADKSAGSLKVNMSKGAWCDFATGDKGGDLIDLVQYIQGGSHVDACNALADFLNVTPSGAKAAPAPASSRAKAPEWEALLPIPAAAMSKIHYKHRQHGKPSKVWIYRDANAEPLMALYRFDLKPDEDGKPRKAFAPLTWCRSANGETHCWRWQGLPEPRPLLRLDELAQRPEAPVVVCEGEKSADAAAVLLPDHVATCWPNGAQSWQKADFAPLAGRDVLLWPDNDDNGAGQACMAALAQHLQRLGAASVRTVAIEVFTRRPVMRDGAAAFEDGGAWADGDDAADALAKGWMPEHLSALAQTGELFAALPAPAQVSKATPETSPKDELTNNAGKPGNRVKRQPERRPGASTNNTSGEQLTGFRVTNGGVVYYSDEGERPVCSRLDILARTRDDKGNNWGLLVEFDDPDGAKKRLNIPLQALAGEFTKEVVGPLASMGLRMAIGRNARNCRNDLQTYLQSYDSTERARLVNRLGWHDGAYLLPGEQLGDNTEHLHFYEGGTALPPIEQAGTLEEWQQDIARFGESHPVSETHRSARQQCFRGRYRCCARCA